MHPHKFSDEVEREIYYASVLQTGGGRSVRISTVVEALDYFGWMIVSQPDEPQSERFPVALPPDRCPPWAGPRHANGEPYSSATTIDLASRRDE
jgi:hypothetical protein